MADQSPFEQTYPALALWVDSYGWLEIGDDGMNRSFIRILDEGGMAWEGGGRGRNLGRSLAAAEAAPRTIPREEFNVDLCGAGQGRLSVRRGPLERRQTAGHAHSGQGVPVTFAASAARNADPVSPPAPGWGIMGQPPPSQERAR